MTQSYLELKVFCSELFNDNSILQYLVCDCSVFIIQFVINTKDKLCHYCLVINCNDKQCHNCLVINNNDKLCHNCLMN